MFRCRFNKRNGNFELQRLFSNNERQRLVDRGRELIGNSTGGLDEIPFLGGLIGRGLSYLVPGSGITGVFLKRIDSWILIHCQYLTSDYDSLRKEQGFPGYAVYYKRRSDKVEQQDVANPNVFVQLLEIDSKLGSVNEDQLAGLLMCPFPNLEFINVRLSQLIMTCVWQTVCLILTISFRLFQLQVTLQRISADMLHTIWQRIMIKPLTEIISILITTLVFFENWLN